MEPGALLVVFITLIVAIISALLRNKPSQTDVEEDGEEIFPQTALEEEGYYEGDEVSSYSRGGESYGEERKNVSHRPVTEQQGTDIYEGTYESAESSGYSEVQKTHEYEKPYEQEKPKISEGGKIEPYAKETGKPYKKSYKKPYKKRVTGGKVRAHLLKGDLDDFSSRKAVIYSEIINRKY